MSYQRKRRGVATLWPILPSAGLPLAALLAGCASSGSLDATTPASQPGATAEASDAVKAGRVPAGMSRVDVFLGLWHFPEAQWIRQTENAAPADLYVNGVDVGGVNPGECLALDLPPGDYSFGWYERSQYPYAVDSLKTTLSAGESLFLSMDVDQHVGAAVPNSVHGYFAAQSDGLAKIKTMQIVVPDEAAVKQLR